jgi:hypothetical protein
MSFALCIKGSSHRAGTTDSRPFFSSTQEQLDSYRESGKKSAAVRRESKGYPYRKF